MQSLLCPLDGDEASFSLLSAVGLFTWGHSSVSLPKNLVSTPPPLPPRPDLHNAQEATSSWPWAHRGLGWEQLAGKGGAGGDPASFLPPPSAQASAQNHSPHTAYLCIPLPAYPTPTSSKVTNFWKPGGAGGWSRGCPEDCTSLVWVGGMLRDTSPCPAPPSPAPRWLHQ